MNRKRTPAATADGEGETRKAEARVEILRAAAELFMRFGFSATSIDAVAESLGATKGHIYHYYRSKAELFFDIQNVAMGRLLEAVEPLAREPGPAIGRLAEMALAHVRVLLSDLAVQKVAVQGLERQLFASGPAAAKQLRAVVKARDDYEMLFAEVIDLATRDGLVLDQPPRLLTKPFLGAMNWATVWYTPRRLQTPEDVEEIARTLAGCAVRGLLVDSGRPEIRALPLFKPQA